MAKVNNSILNFLTNFSVQIKVVFLMVFMISGIVFWNISYYSMTKKMQAEHEYALQDFKKVEVIVQFLKAVQYERFMSVMYLKNSSDTIALQASWKASDAMYAGIKPLTLEEIAPSNKIKKIITNYEALTTTRRDILKKEYDSEDAIRHYSDALIKHALDVVHLLLQHNRVNSLIAYTDLQSALEYTALSRDLTFVVMQTKEFDIDWFERLSMIEARAQSYFDHYKMNSDKGIREVYFNIYDNSYFIKINQLKQVIRNQFSQDENETDTIFNAKLWYQSNNAYIRDLHALIGLQTELINLELNQIHENDIEVENKNILLLVLPLLLVIIIAFYFFLDIRFALKVILSFLNGRDNVTDDRKYMLREAKNEFGDVYRALLKYNSDISEQMEINKKTYEFDTLTDLPNRVKLLQVLDHKIKRAQKQTLMYIDIFNFSYINNSFGQEIGDIYLKESSKVLLELLDRVGIEETQNISVFRMGSDEFVILCAFDNKEEDIVTQLQRTYLVEYDDIVIPLSFTFGVAKAESATTPSALLSYAELAANYAKQNHKHFEYFEKYMLEETDHKDNLEWVKKISNAFDNGLFEVHYQPIFETVSKKLIKYEVLIRMRDVANDAVITPGDFLEILQKSGHEKDLTKVIIDQSFKSFEYCGVDLSINMTSDDLDDEMVEYLINEAAEHNIEPESIAVELVESEELLKARYIDIIKRIKAYGFKLAIDDFGTGYSNFAYLTQIKPDYIKIDGSLVRDICENEQHARVVEGIFDFAQSLDIETIAEFVSNEAIYDRIKEIGIEYVQGFYLGEVMSCDTIKAKKKLEQ